MLGASATQSYEQTRNSFIGRNMHDRHSDKVTAVGETNNPPDNEKEKLGQCHRYKIKGKKDSRCKQQATVQPHKGKNKHLVFCEECWEIKRDKNKESCARNRLQKKTKFKHEKQQILEVVDKGKLLGLSLMAKQFQVMILRLPFMSQLVSVRNAFHSKQKSVRTDEDWTHRKKLKPNDAVASRATAARRKAICHYRTFGATRDWQRELEG